MFSYIRSAFGRAVSGPDHAVSRHLAALALLAEPARTPEQERRVQQLESMLFFDDSLLAAATRVRPLARGSVVLGLMIGLMAAVATPGATASTESARGGSENSETGGDAGSGLSFWERLLEWVVEGAGLTHDEDERDRDGDA